jgi:hypothetical protein
MYEGDQHIFGLTRGAILPLSRRSEMKNGAA